MKIILKQLQVFGRWAIFFFIIFEMMRLIFVCINFESAAKISFHQLLMSFWYGIRQDLSAIGYLLVLPVLSFVFNNIANKFFYWRKLVIGYTNTVLFILALMTVLDALLYRHWGYHMDTTVLLYLKSPSLVFAYTGLWNFMAALSLSILVYLTFRFVFRKLILPFLEENIYVDRNIPIALVWLLVGGSLIIPIRGGLQQIPINISVAYFSSESFANHSAVNILWNIGYSATKQGKLSKTWHFMPDEKAANIHDSLYHHVDTIPNGWLKTPRPNVVLILLESFTANIIEPLGGEKGITPNFNALSKEGIFFKHCYANGDHSEKGLLSIFSAAPDLPDISIIAYPPKFQQLPGLIPDLTKQGYETRFYMGGEIEFANFKAFLHSQGIGGIVSKSDFPSSSYNVKWGVHDHVTYQRLLDDLSEKGQEKPFFYSLFTISSHEPFDVPMETVIRGDSKEDKFRNAAFYADKSLGEFIAKAKLQPWWDNTLVILVADHGVKLPWNLHNHEEQKFKIPMLWLGGALAKDSMAIDTYCSQTDLIATLFHEMYLPYQKYPHSKPISAKDCSSFAYYTFNEGMAWITPQNKAIFDLKGNQLITSEGNSNDALQFCRAYLQHCWKGFHAE
jgi:phosphoglycerol transferase MdoB-like AlkP superfamily enzyme